MAGFIGADLFGVLVSMIWPTKVRRRMTGGAVNQVVVNSREGLIPLVRARRCFARARKSHST